MRSLQRFAFVIGTCVAWSFASHFAAAQDSELKTATVAAFKNGLAFVVKQGDVHLEGGVGNLEPVPNATVGSLWIASNDQGASLDQIVARHYRVSAREHLIALAEVLLANAGKVVTVTDNGQKEYTGEIVGFRRSDTTKKPGESSGPSSNPDRQDFYPSIVPAATAGHAPPEFLLLKSEGKLLALYFHNIARVVLPPDAVLEESQETEHRALQFKVKGVTDHAHMTMGYLEHGMGWTPSYLISLQDDKKAQITMQAVLVNDAEDLKNTDLFFVVGVPNFAYSNIPSPMALQQNLLEFMQAAARKDDMSNARYSNALTGQMIGGIMDAEAAPSLVSTIEELQGSPEEDLFLYTRKGVTLAQGERATYNVFSDSVNYEHIYEWSLEDQPRVDASGIAQNIQATGSDRSTKQNVWHALRLKNTTIFPWTSAPTLVISGSKPLAQDTLIYTPKTASSILKLTIATDIRASHEENEVERQRDVQRRHNYNYDQVTVEGKLTVKNYKSKAVQLSITDRVRGTVESQTDDGKSEKLAEAITVDNPLSRLRWEITLQAGEEKTIKYRYKVWLRV